MKPRNIAINVGNNTLYDTTISGTVDLAGNPRLVGNTIDMGVYEATPYILTPDYLTSKAINIAASAGSKTGLRFISNVDWIANIPAADTWLTVDKIQSFGNDTITFTASANPLTTSRSTIVNLSETTMPIGPVKRYAVMGKTTAVKNDNPATLSVTVIQAPGTATGTANLNIKDVVLYPNPVVDRLYVLGLKGKSKLTVIDITGKIVLSAENIQNFSDVSCLKSGIYLINISDENGNRTGKFTKK